VIPTDFRGGRLWLDAADASTVTDVSGVVQWTDKSPVSNLCSQGGDPSWRPPYLLGVQNGLNGIDFNGTTQFLIGGAMGISGTQATTIFIVATPKTNSTASIAFSQGEITPTADGQERTYDLQTSAFNSGIRFNGRFRTFNENMVNNTPYILCFTNPAGAAVADFDRYVNGVLSTQSFISTGSLNLVDEAYVVGSMRDGTLFPYNGTIFEIAAFGREFSSDERLDLTASFSQKWAIALP